MSTLQSNGFTAWFAGGCVRDGLLGRSPKDFDVATNAKPNEVLKVFPDGNQIGKSFGVIQVKIDSASIEIATFRKDGAYSDGRHPDFVEFSEPQEDAKRRDFTINGMFLDPVSWEIIDYVEGKIDIQAQIIRCIGDPNQRFSEDKLRILRAFRFSSELGYAIEENTRIKALQLGSELNQIAQERIYEEFKKLVMGEHAPEILKELLFVPWNKYLFGDSIVESRGVEVLKLIPYIDRVKGFLPRVAFLFCSHLEKSKASLEASLKVLKFSGHEIKTLVEFYQFLILLSQSLRVDGKLVIAFEKMVPSDFFQALKSLQQTQSLNEELVDKVVEAYSERVGVSGRLPEPLIKGEDLLSQGIKKGPQIGDLLSQAYEIQIWEKISSKSEILSRLS